MKTIEIVSEASILPRVGNVGQNHARLQMLINESTVWLSIYDFMITKHLFLTENNSFKFNH